MGVLVLAPLAGPAVARAQGGPDDAARGFLAALDARRWNDAAARVLPRAARRQQRAEVSMMLAWAEQRASGRVQRGTTVVSAPDSIVPALLQQFGDQPARGFGAARTVADLARMEPAAYMARTLQNALTLPPGACCAAFGKNQYVGTLENDSVAHALYRERGEAPLSAPGGDPYGVSVLELRREGGRWYVVPDPMLLPRAESLAAMADAGGTR
jgi:hypothetical protein